MKNRGFFCCLILFFSSLCLISCEKQNDDNNQENEFYRRTILEMCYDEYDKYFDDLTLEEFEKTAVKLETNSMVSYSLDAFYFEYQVYVPEDFITESDKNKDTTVIMYGGSFKNMKVQVYDYFESNQTYKIVFEDFYTREYSPHHTQTDFIYDENGNLSGKTISDFKEYYDKDKVSVKYFAKYVDGKWDFYRTEVYSYVLDTFKGVLPKEYYAEEMFGKRYELVEKKIYIGNKAYTTIETEKDQDNNLKIQKIYRYDNIGNKVSEAIYRYKSDSWELIAEYAYVDSVKITLLNITFNEQGEYLSMYVAKNNGSGEMKVSNYEYKNGQWILIED